MMDLGKVRADTPAAEHRAYLHNAGAALMPRPVVAAIKNHIDLEAEIGGYAAARREHERCEAVYSSVARLLNAAPEEIALVENATVAWQMAFYSLSFAPGDRILTAEAEYAANYVAFLQMAKRTGAVIDVVPSNEAGELDTAALQRMIDERVKLIAITWVPTNGGLTNPAAAIGRIARAHGIPYLLDACQAVGQMPADVEELHCDMLSATGRKFLRGPRGTGFLYVRKSLLDHLEPPMIDHYAAPWAARDRYELRPDARRFENWENNYAARLGLGAAIDYALAIGLAEIDERCHLLSQRLRYELSGIDGVTIRDLGRNPSAIVSFTIDGIDARDAVKKADEVRITIGASDPASTRIDAEKRRLPDVVRASPHYYNTEEEVDRLVELCRRIRS
jgi:cysteine desulfurase/selenocysteine lyase